MKQEILRLTLLFATFVFAYILRFAYQLGLETDIYLNGVQHMTTRWAIIMFLPCSWDLTSIVSILILHF